MEAFDPSAAVTGTGGQEEDAASTRRRRPDSMWNQSVSESSTVRDVSWHSSEPAIMSTAWDGPDGAHGSLAKHVSLSRVQRILNRFLTLVSLSLQEWKGFGKNGLSLEDAIEKSIAEAAR